MKRSKRYKTAREKLDKLRKYPVAEAVKVLKELHSVKFDESLEIAIRLGVNPKHADQMVRGTVALPHGTGKSIKVLVFAQGEKVAEATEAGADFVGGDELAEKVQGGWTGFDVAVATPDMMRVVGKLGKVLGPRGLMPNPKTGTVTTDLTRTINELKAGRIEFRIDRQANIQAAIGRLSFDENKMVENVYTFVDAIVRAKPTVAKGTYMLGVALSSTMGPGFKLDIAELLAAAKK